MEPIFKSSTEDFILFQGNCLDLIGQLHDNAFQTIFADPPYFLSNGGISVQSGKVVCVDKGEWDKNGSPKSIYEFNKQWLSLCRSKLKENGTIWITGTYHNINTVATCLIELGYKILNMITWAKTNPPPNISCRYFTYSTEFIIWARKSSKTPHYFDYDCMKFINGGKQMRDVWNLPAISTWEKTCGKHPTQKPLALLSRILLASTKKDDWVFDPFAGSSTTGIAANLIGRKYVGIEQESHFINISIKRREELEDLRYAAKMRMKIKDIKLLEINGYI